MSCSDFDLKGYFFGELAEDDRRLVEEHVADCALCREEWERLQVTQTALHSIRDEEIPQRIAFVSDKVFEPRWYQRLWRSGPRLGFASAAMLSAAILVHAFTRPPAAVAPQLFDTAAVQAVIEKEVAARLQIAIEQAIAASETRQTEETARLLAAAEERFEMERETYLLAVEDAYEVLRKRSNVFLLASANQGGQ